MHAGLRGRTTTAQLRQSCREALTLCCGPERRQSRARPRRLRTPRESGQSTLSTELCEPFAELPSVRSGSPRDARAPGVSSCTAVFIGGESGLLLASRFKFNFNIRPMEFQRPVTVPHRPAHATLSFVRDARLLQRLTTYLCAPWTRRRRGLKLMEAKWTMVRSRGRRLQLTTTT